MRHYLCLKVPKFKRGWEGRVGRNSEWGFADAECLTLCNNYMIMYDQSRFSTCNIISVLHLPQPELKRPMYLLSKKSHFFPP